MSQRAASQMRLQKSGHIVSITSSIVDQPVAGLTGSFINLTKGGLGSVTRALAIALYDSKFAPLEDVIQIESPNRLQPVLLLCSARPDALEVTVRNSKEIG